MAKLLNNSVVLTIAAILIFAALFVFQDENYFNEFAPYNLISIDIPLVKPLSLPQEKLANPPEVVKAVYVTAGSANSLKYLNYLDELFNNTQINSVVVDFKGLYNPAGLVKKFHQKNVYVIARITVFQDTEYAKSRPDLAIYDEKLTTDKKNPILWADSGGHLWLDPASKEVWDYSVKLSQEAFFNGFDEVNFDYIRFPSDGSEENMGFPFWDTKTFKIKIIKNFFEYLRSNLPEEKISADLFGQTTTDADGLGMGIGQLIENAFENFDYVCPMVYPSHYVDGFMNFENPAEHPYEIVKYSLDSALAKRAVYDKAMQNLPQGQIEAQGPITQVPLLAKIRPWLQDFSMGANYTADMAEAEIQAVKDALGPNYNGFMLWSPRNIYTEEPLKN